MQSFFDVQKAAKTINLAPLMAPPGYAFGTAEHMVWRHGGFKNVFACKMQFLTVVECIFRCFHVNVCRFYVAGDH